MDAFKPPETWWEKLSLADQAAAREDYEERAAIMQFMGDMSRSDAESRAAELIRQRWADRARGAV